MIIFCRYLDPLSLQRSTETFSKCLIACKYDAVLKRKLQVLHPKYNNKEIKTEMLPPKLRLKLANKAETIKAEAIKAEAIKAETYKAKANKAETYKAKTYIADTYKAEAYKSKNKAEKNNKKTKTLKKPTCSSGRMITRSQKPKVLKKIVNIEDALLEGRIVEFCLNKTKMEENHSHN